MLDGQVEGAPLCLKVISVVANFLVMWPIHENMFSVMDPDRIINTHINHMEFVAPAIQRMRHINFLDDRRDRANVERAAKLLNFLTASFPYSRILGF